MIMLLTGYLALTLAIVGGHLAYSLCNGRPFPSGRALLIALLLWPVWAVSKKQWRRLYPGKEGGENGGAP